MYISKTHFMSNVNFIVQTNYSDFIEPFTVVSFVDVFISKELNCTTNTIQQLQIVQKLNPLFHYGLFITRKLKIAIQIFLMCILIAIQINLINEIVSIFFIIRLSHQKQSYLSRIQKTAKYRNGRHHFYFSTKTEVVVVALFQTPFC